jgi:hypothetical protein
MHYKLKEEKINSAFAANGVLVIADTRDQVKKALKAIDKYRTTNAGFEFMFVVDEVDAMYRTKGRHQKFEQGMEELLAQRPVMVSFYMSCYKFATSVRC